MRIAVVKPDWHIRGGFEAVVARVETDLRSAGHEVDRVEVDVPALAHEAFGIAVDDHLWSRAPEWFGHLAMLDRFRGLDLSEYDMVLSTQPPSYAVRHRHHLSLFYHHARAFYDLEEVWVTAGRLPAALHTPAAAMLRAAEAEDLRGVTHFLAGSPRVAERLRRFGGPDVPVSLYRSPAPQIEEVDHSTLEHVLVVSRHEFTKRTELAVQALALSAAHGVLVGDGGRLPFVRKLAAKLAEDPDAAAHLDASDLWLNSGIAAGEIPERAAGRVNIVGRVSDARLDQLYRTAVCVLAPAYDEDDGLTVLEAMARGRAVIVCRDGGGLTALVEDGVNGFVVDPDGPSIAAAITMLDTDHELARRMGEAARATAQVYTPQRAREQLFAAVEGVMGGRGQ